MRPSQKIILASFLFLACLQLAVPLLFPEHLAWHNLLSKLFWIPILLGAYYGGFRGGALLGLLAALFSGIDLIVWCGPSHPLFINKIVEAGVFLFMGPVLGGVLEYERRRQEWTGFERRRTQKGRSLSVVDSLTQAYNRDYFDTVLKDFWEEAQREGSHFSLLMIDLDNLKHINQAHGHQAGDTVLRSAAQTILGHTRSTDMVFRYGGDEFLLLLPKTPKEFALSLAKRLRQEMDKITFRSTTSGYKENFSIGIVEYRAQFKNRKEMLNRLSRTLRQAKKEETQVALAS